MKIPDRLRVTIGLSALVFMFTLIICFECLHHPLGEASAAVDYELKSKPTATVGRNDRAADVVAILERPLFRANRRPIEESGAPRGASDPGRLTGILLGQGIARLIFAGVAGGKPVVVTEGDHVGADTVQSISSGQAILLGPGGLKTVRPSFSDPQASASAPEAAGNRQDHALDKGEPRSESRMSRHQPVH